MLGRMRRPRRPQPKFERIAWKPSFLGRRILPRREKTEGRLEIFAPGRREDYNKGRAGRPGAARRAAGLPPRRMEVAPDRARTIAEMSDYSILLELALILLLTKILGLATKRLGLPQVVGSLIAGLVLGPCVLGWVRPSAPLRVIAELGVILIMFSAGLETNLKDLRSAGAASTVVAVAGVALPLGAGFLIGAAFNGGFRSVPTAVVLKNVFTGVVMTATSVSITVTALRELGRLKTRAGTIILSAAVIDDVIGIVLLSVIMGFKTPGENAWATLVKILNFFIFSIVAGLLIHRLFKWLDRRFPHTRRIPIFGLALCFFLAYVGERFFGVADVTGAYFAGIMLSGLRDTSYIDRKVEIGGYMFFEPIFFASIGVNVDFSNFDAGMIWFSLAFVGVAIVAKMLGCFIAAKSFRLGLGESAVIGAGMIARGEVCLIVLQKGMAAKFVGSEYMAMGVMLVIITSFLAPVLVKAIYALTDRRALSVSPHLRPVPVSPSGADPSDALASGRESSAPFSSRVDLSDFPSVPSDAAQPSSDAAQPSSDRSDPPSDR